MPTYGIYGHETRSATAHLPGDFDLGPAWSGSGKRCLQRWSWPGTFRLVNLVGVDQRCLERMDPRRVH